MKEEEIRPQELFNRYLEVARQDIRRFFNDKSQFVEVSCPACCSADSEFAFDKLGFQYRTCRACLSLYLSPRPTAEAIDRYYQEGQAVKFWSTDFYRETAEARREKIFKPRAQLIADLAKSGLLTKRETFVDVGAGYGIFLEEIARLGVFEKVLGIEPAPNMARACRQKGFEIIEKPMEAVMAAEVRADLVASFEVLEHVFSPWDLLRSIYRILDSGGLVLFTTLTISGFDLQVLWDRSKSIYPPHHINLISVEGMRSLVEGCGFEVLELVTPGKLDIDIVANAVRESPDITIPRFVKYMLEKRGEKTHQAFQTFLQENNLSSHIRCIARKRM